MYVWMVRKWRKFLIPSCDGYEDFKKLTIHFESDGCHDLTFVFGEGISIQSIRTETEVLLSGETANLQQDLPFQPVFE